MATLPQDDDLAPYRDGRSSADNPHEELTKFLQELRVMLPGVQVLFAFLLTVPFTQRFSDLSGTQRSIYFTALLAAAAATVSIIAPSINHRLRWHEGAAEDIMRTGNRAVITGTVFLAVSVGAAVFLISDLLYGATLAGVVTAVLVGSAAALWWILPLIQRAREGADNR